MDSIVVLRTSFLLGMAWLANGYLDIPEGPGCANLVPYYELERPSQTFDTPFFSDNWNEADLQYLTTFSPSSRIGLNRRKRSTENDRKEGEFPLPYSTGRENVKTIHIASSFTPRLGKRSDQDLEDMLYEDRSHEIDMEGNEFTSRLGRGEGPNRIQLNAGSAFTPRLGRAEGPNRIQLNPGSAFTPRLGRSENPNKIMLNAGSAFTPRLGRSEGHRRVQLNAGSAFTPRLGRSEGPNTIQLNAGSTFTPRLGRSENHRTIQLNAGSAFTPRLGRSDGTNKITLSTGNAFTPRLGRSDGQRITLYPGSAFTPRLG